MDESNQTAPYEVVATPLGQMIILSTEGGVLSASESADLIGMAWSETATWVAVPAERLGDDFFHLRTRVAGEIAQRFVNYRIGLIVLGDITRYTEASASLRDFVRESNAGTQLWFVADRAQLADGAGSGSVADFPVRLDSTDAVPQHLP